MSATEQINPKICTGCLKIIETRQFLKCSKCQDEYDLDCANCSIQRYILMTPEHKLAWSCVTCLRKLKLQSHSTGQHEQYHDKQDADLLENINVTIRKPRKYQVSNSSSSSIDDLSLLGDTIVHGNINSPQSQPPAAEALTVSQLERILDMKLAANRQSLIQEIKQSIFAEFKSALSELKTEMNTKINTVSCNQKSLQNSISEIDKNINILTTENTKLKNELDELKRQFSNTKDYVQPNPTKSDENNTATCKKIVLNGLREDYYETEVEVHDRVINIFRDILNVNTAGYIEDLTRIGRRNDKRPLVIELLSKRLARHLLQYKHLFKNTGMAISEYLDQDSIQQRRKLRESMLEARRNGSHAVIRNNKLIVNGKEVKQIQENIMNTENSENKNTKTTTQDTRRDTKSTEKQSTTPQDNSFRKTL
ncbi:hypothetical protein NE865_02569 [Phthorimaea operculella]|nr:hypothetical protein NE865_02569 [Phthorimaea operculella]